MNYSKRLLILVLLATLARLIIAACIGLGNDEVYYWTYAQQLQWNYFDHPPMVGWLIRLTTANLLLHHEIFVRLGAIICSAICTLLIYNAATIASNPRAGWYAALLYTTSIYSSIIAGTFIMPDSPQMAFWLWGIFLLLKIAKSRPNNPRTTHYWCWFGVAAGLCIMCKVHGVFLWLGAGLYIPLYNKKWLANKGIYIAAIITAIIISPIIIWNIQNNFISYTYHGSRVTISNGSIHIDSFLKELFGGFFYNNPFNFILIWLAVFTTIKTKIITDKNATNLLRCCSLPLIFLLLGISLFRDTLPHWSGPAYSTLIILAAAKMATTKSSNIPFVIKWALTFIIVISVGGMLLINYYPGTLSAEKNGLKTGEEDFTLDMYGWRDAGNKIDSLFKQDLANKTMLPNTTIVTNKWFPAAHIDFYIAAISGRQTYALGPIFDLHQYYWLNKYKKPLEPGENAYLIVPSNLYSDATIAYNKQFFDSISLPIIIPQFRGKILCRQFYVYRLHGFRKTNDLLPQ